MHVIDAHLPRSGYVAARVGLDLRPYKGGVADGIENHCISWV